jgi:hypothetical protein
MRNGVRSVAGATALVAAYLQFGPALAQSKPSEIKIGVCTGPDFKKEKTKDLSLFLFLSLRSNCRSTS